MAKATVETVFDAITPTIDQLASRWKEEEEHGDFADYAAKIKKVVFNNGGNFTKLTKRPFAAHYEVNGTNAVAKVKSAGKHGIKIIMLVDGEPNGEEYIKVGVSQPKPGGTMAVAAEPHHVCILCDIQKPQSELIKFQNGWTCATNEACKKGKTVTEQVKVASSRAVAEKAEKKTAAAKKDPVVIRYAPTDTPSKRKPLVKVARQMQIIITIIRENSSKKEPLLKADLLKRLDEANGKGYDKYDLATKQTPLAILMHYQRRMIDEGYVTLIK